MEKLNSFYYALSLLETMYGIEMEEDDFAEVGLIAWDLIGNKIVRLYHYSACVDECEHSVDLPCNLFEIEAVTTGFEEWDYSTNDTPNGKLHSAFTEEYIEHRKAFRHPLYQPGKFIKYERVGNKLYFDHYVGTIHILYKGIILDDNDLPELTDKEALAIATYVAYTLKFKEGLQNNNANSVLLANTLLALWNKRCSLARIDYYMSQNEWDQVLDAKTQWGRKQYGRSFKIIQ